MRKNGREVAAVFMAFAVILAAGLSSTEQPSVVCAEENGIDTVDVLTAEDGDVEDTEPNDSSGQTEESDISGDDEIGGGTDEAGNGTETGDDETDVEETGNDETDVEETPDVSDDMSNVTEEDEMLLMGGISAFSLEDGKNTEECGSMEALSALLEQHNDGVPVKAILSKSIEVTEPIQLSENNALILDLGGNSISASTTAVSMEKGGHLTITGSGKVSSNTGNTVNVTKGTLVVEGGEIIAVSRDEGDAHVGAIDVGSDGKVEIRGGTVSGKGFALAINGGSAEISGGTVKAESTGDVHAIQVNSGNLTVSSGDIIGNGGEASGALFMQGGSAKIEGGNLKTNVTTGYGFTCYAIGRSNLTITGGNFVLEAPAGKSLCIGSEVTTAVSGGSYSGGGIGITTGADSNPPTLGEWAGAFYAGFGGGILSDNTFYKEGAIVYTKPSVSVSGGTWNNSCKETRTLTEKTAYSFGSEGWMVEDDATVYSNCKFYAPANETYTFIRK